MSGHGKKRAGSGECQLCGTWRYSLHRDHKIPKFKGGSDEESNIQLLCANCHEDKSREEKIGWPGRPRKKSTARKQSKSLKAYWDGVPPEERSRRLKESASKRTKPYPKLLEDHVKALRRGYKKWQKKKKHDQSGQERGRYSAP